MNQTQAQTMFYGNPGVDQRQYLGLASRYSSLSAGNSQNILNAGGVGSDNTSIYLVVWGESTVFCTYPKNTKAGLSHRDLGVETVKDDVGNDYQAARSLFQWDNGLVVKDWRYVVRIANIDVSDWVGVTGTQALAAGTNVIKLMSRAIDRIPNMSMGRAAFYANRSIFSGLKLQALERSQNVVTVEKALDQFGREKTDVSFLGVPMRCTDALGVAETVVV
jgi:hypothetical protein